ncbi:MAG: 23S rRNA (adenine(2030)-N(6))-methyltransferase RlmJ [Treponema sp.]|nr:23S rRNA (adenine(2030)-N(6))-methyltransferase RlmJ [Treponema sp.]
MLSYQHAYHAGNHADILKHYILLNVLQSLNKKDKAYTFFDTHSGSGFYDLYDNCSIKTGEAENGITRLLKVCASLSKENLQIPTELKSYLDFIQKSMDKMIYSGSPKIEYENMRAGDILILSELHPQEIEKLKSNMHSLKTENGPELQIHKRNGWEMIKALTPPKTKRGAVLIDPSYETSEDYDLAAKVIVDVFKKWTNGIFLLWYPLLVHRENEINSMLDFIKTSIHAINSNIETADIRLCVQDKNAHQEMSLEDYRIAENNPSRLYGSGMFIINPPWKLQEEADTVIPFLEKILK